MNYHSSLYFCTKVKPASLLAGYMITTSFIPLFLAIEACSSSSSFVGAFNVFLYSSCTPNGL